MMYVFLGLSKSGIICAFINTNLRSKSLLHCVQVSQAKAIIVGKSKCNLKYGFVFSYRTRVILHLRNDLHTCRYVEHYKYWKKTK